MRLTDTEAHDLLARLASLTDRRARRGRRHRLCSILAVAACATISGARGATAIAEWAERADAALLRRLHCRRDPAARGVYLPSSEPTIRRALTALQAGELERVLGDWPQRQH